MYIITDFICLLCTLFSRRVLIGGTGDPEEVPSRLRVASNLLSSFLEIYIKVHPPSNCEWATVFISIARICQEKRLVWKYLGGEQIETLKGGSTLHRRVSLDVVMGKKLLRPGEMPTR